MKNLESDQSECFLCVGTMTTDYVIVQFFCVRTCLGVKITYAEALAKKIVSSFFTRFFVMSDSEITTTPSRPSTSTRGAWSRKRQKREQAVRARLSKRVHRPSSDDSSPSTNLPGPSTPSTSAAETTRDHRDRPSGTMARLHSGDHLKRAALQVN